MSADVAILAPTESYWWLFLLVAGTTAAVLAAAAVHRWWDGRWRGEAERLCGPRPVPRLPPLRARGFDVVVLSHPAACAPAFTDAPPAGPAGHSLRR